MSSRTRRFTPRLAPLVVLVGLGAADPAKGQEPTRPYHVSYRGGSGCPEDGGLIEQIALRTDRARLAAPGEAAITFVVDVEANPRSSGARGRLEIVEVDGVRSLREVHGASCTEVVAALGLIIAVVLDPHVRSSLEPTSPASGLPAGAEEGAGRSPRIEGSEIAGPGDAYETPPPSGETSGAWQIGLGGLFGAPQTLLPGAPLAPAPYAEALLSRGAVSLLMRASVHLVGGERVSRQPHGDADFSLSAVRVSGCPLRWPVSDPLALRPCLFLEGGVLAASGVNTEQEAAHELAWWAAGALGRLEWLVGGPVLLELEGGIVVPLRRGDSFYFRRPTESPLEVFRVPAVGATAQAGLGIRLP